MTQPERRRNNQLFIDSFDGFLSRRIDGQHHDTVRVKQRARKTIGEIAGPRVEMGLEDHHQPATGKGLVRR